MSSHRHPWLYTLVPLTVLAVAGAAFLGWWQADTLSPATLPSKLLSLRAIPCLQMLFIAAAASSLPALVMPQWRAGAWGLLLLATGLAAGLLLLIPYENSRLLEAPPTGSLFGVHAALTNLYQVSIALLAITGALALGYERVLQAGQGAHNHGTLLPFITPLLAVAALFTGWLVTTGAATPVDLTPALQNAILPFHVLANFIGYGCFAVAAAAAVALLLRHRADAHGRSSPLPTVAVLENLSHRAIVLGFPMFTIAILLGCVWAWQAWGGYWSWDPKETWALIVWLLYAAYLHVRAARAPRPAVLAWWLIIAFFATLFCYLGVNMFLSGLHSYGTLQP